MELRELISFHHVARLRSVSKAARVLELGQPTVTTHLRKLEDEFGILLFDRIKRPIQLTSEGIVLSELVAPVVEAVDTLKNQMDYAEHRGSFTVGAYPDLVMHHLPNAIQSFRMDFPDVRIRLMARPYATLIQLIKSGEVDLGLCSPPPADDPSFQYQEVFGFNVVLMTPPDHPLLEHHPIQLEEIAKWPLILSGPESLTRRRVEQVLKEQGISYDIVLAMDETESIKRYVETGMGVAIGADFTLHQEDHDLLGVVRLDHIFSGGTIGVCTLKGKFLGPAVRSFVDTMVQHLRGYHADLWDWETLHGNPKDLDPVTSEDR